MHKKIVLEHTILYSQCVDLLIWIPTKLSFLFYDFYVIYCDFLKISAKINKKKKVNRFQNQIKDVMRTVSKVKGCILSGFKVQGWKSDFRESQGRLFPVNKGRYQPWTRPSGPLLPMVGPEGRKGPSVGAAASTFRSRAATRLSSCWLLPPILSAAPRRAARRAMGSQWASRRHTSSR